MELRQLEYFVAVAEEASFTRAAARLYVTQPGVSSQVRRLEKELGQELLDRTGPAVRLTEVGTAVLAAARAALDGVTSVRATVDEFTGLIRGRVSVGMVRSCSLLDLPPLLAAFHAEHPHVSVTLSEANSDVLLEELRTGRLDAAVVALAGEDPPGVVLHVLADEPLVAAVGEDDPLAGHRSVPLDALRHRSLICLPRGTGMRTCLENAFRAEGWEPRVAFEASDPHVLARLAARSLGPAVLPGSLVAEHPQLRAVAVTSPLLRGRMALAWRREGPPGPAARRFLARARAALPPVSASSG